MNEQINSGYNLNRNISDSGEKANGLLSVMTKTWNDYTENVEQMARNVDLFQDYIRNSSIAMMKSFNTGSNPTPYEVVYEEDRIKVMHYKASPQAKSKPITPLLIADRLMHRETMLDLYPGRSVVQDIIEEGIDLYVVYWGYPSGEDKYLTIDDHVSGYMNHVIDFLIDKHETPKINLMGICMGGMLSIMYAALYPEKIKNLITIETPTSFGQNAGLLYAWVKSIDADILVDTFGNFPADVMNYGMNFFGPKDSTLDGYRNIIENTGKIYFVDNFVRMAKWVLDSPDVPDATFRQLIKDCYQNNLLIQNKMNIGGKKINLKKLTMPLLNIYAEYDHLVPPVVQEKQDKNRLRRNSVFMF